MSKDVWWTDPEVYVDEVNGRRYIRVHTEVHVPTVDAALRLVGAHGARLRLSLIDWAHTWLRLSVATEDDEDVVGTAVVDDALEVAVDELVGRPGEGYPALAAFADADARKALVRAARALVDSAATAWRLSWGSVVEQLWEGC